MKIETAPKNLDEWVALICEQEMPVFDMTARKVIAFTSDELAPISELANVILRDAALTARVLKLANSVFYNPMGVSISTITRSVVVLGFNAVRDICLAVRLIDALVKGAARERLGHELALALHTATQARALAKNDKSSEEIFIAALLMRVGEMAFWCYSDEVGEMLMQLYNQPGMTQERAQEQILGFRLSQLSRRLIQEWQLTELLQRAISQPIQADERLHTIRLGQQIARCAEGPGWQSPEMTQLIQRIAKLTERTLDETRINLYQEARVAKQLASDLGADFAIKHIPSPDAVIRGEEEQFTKAKSLASKGIPDGSLRVKILRELGVVLDAGQCDFNIIMELVLEGIYRGIGVDRVVFALSSPDKRILKAKYALGEDQEEVIRGFQFIRSPTAPDLLFQTMDRKLPRWITEKDYDVYKQLIPNGLRQLVGYTPFMLAPIVVHHQCIGLFYADRALSNHPLDATCFDDFKHFVHQANIGIGLGALRPRQKT
ncbi:HDOD domain-containing protein [Chromatium okenii]|uniref:HDOD domain-containing protein n=1 Tax=Chromatium okenii TaxID=61644 RepID=UPI0026F21077|nr:HDOD domain-containing protein [Chromatium okenii]MBV5309204.1 HDOD domain-containing protein [Chromatium okenii]